MARRRVHVSKVQTGVITLAEGESRHVRDVLRMLVDDQVEVFDDSGAVASGKLIEVSAARVDVAVSDLKPREASTDLIVAAAVPKGDRADWMVEKLSELSVSRFIPLATERSVVLPQGKNKVERWMRIATESAKQSRRSGVMRIDSLTSLADALTELATSTLGIVLSTTAESLSLQSAIRTPQSAMSLFVGPEGGWTSTELERFARAGLTPARLTATILRVETAAIAAAAIVAAMIDSHHSSIHRGDQHPPS